MQVWLDNLNRVFKYVILLKLRQSDEKKYAWNYQQKYIININLQTLQSIDVKEYIYLKEKDVTKLFYILCVKIERTCTFQSSLIDDQCLFLCVWLRSGHLQSHRMNGLYLSMLIVSFIQPTIFHEHFFSFCVCVRYVVNDTRFFFFYLFQFQPNSSHFCRILFNK